MCRCPHKFAADLRAAGRGSAVTPHFLPFNYPAVRRAARAQRRAAALSGPASLAFRFPWRLRAVCSPRERACAAVHVRDRAPWLQGRGGGGKRGGWVRGACWLADPASCCHGACGSLRDNLASPEKPRLERHQSGHARVEGAGKKIKA